MVTKKRVTIKDIAQRVDVSLPSVNRALTGKPGVSDALRKEIQDVAHEMGYAVNGIAQVLSRNPLNVGVVMPSAWGDYYNAVKKGMDTAFERLQEYKVNSEYLFISSISSESNADTVRDWVKTGSLDAIILCPTIYTLKDHITRVIKNANIPMILAGGGIDGSGAQTMVLLDADMAGKIAADFFGCFYKNNICAAVFIASKSSIILRQKADSFTNRVKEKGGSVAVVYETSVSDNSIDAKTAYNYMHGLCTQYPEVNCIYVGSGGAEGVCQYISEKGLEDRYIILGTDAYEAIKEYMRRDILQATIYQNPEKLGKTAVEATYSYLVRSRSYSNDDWQLPKQIFVSPTLLLKANFE